LQAQVFDTQSCSEGPGGAVSVFIFLVRDYEACPSNTRQRFDRPRGGSGESAHSPGARHWRKVVSGKIRLMTSRPKAPFATISTHGTEAAHPYQGAPPECVTEFDNTW